MDFRNVDWLALRNKHSNWNNGHFHSAENHMDSEDFDAEIERLFPAAPRNNKDPANFPGLHSTKGRRFLGRLSPNPFGDSHEL